MCPKDMLEVANNFCGKGQAGVCGTAVKFYDWRAFLAQFFDYKKKVTGIMKQHSFRYSAAKPGVVEFKETADPALPWKSASMCITGTEDTFVQRIVNPAFYGLKPLEDFLLAAPGMPEARVKYCKAVLHKHGQDGDVIDSNLFFAPADLESVARRPTPP